MLLRLISALLAIAMLAPAAAAQRATELRIETPWLGLPQVEVLLNNGTPARFIVDSAATQTMLSEATIRRLRIRPSGLPAELRGATGNTALDYYRLASLAIGNRRFSELGAFNLPAQAREVRADGLLGADILRRHVVEFDMPGRAMRLHARRTDFLRMSGETRWDSIPAWQRRDGFLIVEARIGGLTLPALVDTGAVQNYVNTAAARALGIEQIPESASETGVFGASGQVQIMNQFDLSGFALGGAQFGPSRLGVADLALFDALGMEGRPAMILGIEALADRRFVLDYPRSRLLIAR
ncbi:retroviral-like aspartic protease family protein [uncultured Parasphingopyxis sp.]|uniref:aspartyl protease family protein n=1 Tax=uncultured Parasphingopyxis sp. TaxID=1547918 RepID=UPI00260A6F91|nr:retroviral-like aspartic protease family protein [uncultured Parasphingopyxis sp.]